MTDSPRDDLESLPEGIEALRALVLKGNCRIATQRTLSSAMRRCQRDMSDCWHRASRLRHLLLQLKR